MASALTEMSKMMQGRSSIHWARKIWHFGMGTFGLVLFFYLNLSPKDLSLYMICIGVLALILEYIRLKFSIFNEFFCKLMSLLMRKEEISSPTGFAYYVLGIGISLYFFSFPVALLSSCFLIYADPFASFVGVRWGKTKIYNERSLEGSVAFFLVAILICVIIKYLNYLPTTNNEVVFILLSSLGASMFEAFCTSKYLDDNIVIPIASGFWMTMLSKLLAA